MDENKVETVIAADVKITGTVESKGAIRVDGKLEGELICEQDALIGKEASIQGNISAQSATVEGAVHGNITARDRIELRGTARLTGDVKAKRLIVQEGVTFVGRSDVNPSGTPAAAAAPASPAPSKTAASETPAKPNAEPAAEKSDDREGRGGIFGRR